MNGLFRDPRLEEVLMLEGLVPGPALAAVSNVERYTQRPMAELAAAYWRDRDGADRLAQDRVAAAEQESAVMDYYRDTGQYLYELSYVEGSVKRQGWLQVIERVCRRHGVRRALDVGGGIGTVGLYLSRRGIACDHLDVPGKTFDYAAWRFQTHQVQAAMYDATQPWPAGPYDAVIAWDVLEHLKHLEEKIGWLARGLRPGGLLLHWSTFTECEGVHLPENHQYGDIRLYDALLQRHGFRYEGQVKPGRLSRGLRKLGWKTATLGVRLSPRLKFGGCFLLHRVRD